MRRASDPFAAAVDQALNRPKPKIVARGHKARLDLDYLDIVDLINLVLEKVAHCRTRRDQAHTGRRRAIADERLRHWWGLYQQLEEAREVLNDAGGPT